MIISLTIFNLMFPVIGLIIFILLFFMLVKNYKLIVFNIIYSISFLSGVFRSLDGKGDVNRYILYNNNYKNFDSILEVLNEPTLFYTFSWSIVNYLVNKYEISFYLVNFLSIMVIGICLYKILEIFKIEKKYKRLLFLKFFMIFSFPVLFSSYRNLLSFSIIAVGIFLDMKENKKGIIFIILGLGFHLAGLPIVIIYFFSRRFQFKQIYLYSSFFIMIILFNSLFKNFVYKILSDFNNPVIKKISYYLFGEWAKYKIFFQGDIITYYLLIVILFFLFISYKKILNIKVSNILLRRYNNFILIYIAIFLIFLPYRTIAIRFYITGFPFFIPLFYQMLKYYSNNYLYKYTFIFLLFDVRWLVLFFLDDIIFGKGFPNVIFQNLISEILRL